MNVNELMLGDYINAQDREGGNEEGEINIVEYPIRVESIYGDTLLDNYGCERGEGDFAGIPLTSEILEKNGVAKPKLSLWWRLDSPFRDLWLAQHTDGSWWLYSSGDCDKDENFAEIRYVHELQHTLRLCGIDKKIDV